jgi:hypothetical protein
MVEHFECLGTTLKNQNFIGEKLRADRSQGMLAAIIRCRFFVSNFAIQKYTKYARTANSVEDVGVYLNTIL